jgi:predicted enzyme related to lactoylglutathione lyase
MKVNALYVAAWDMDRATSCYADAIFQRRPAFTTERFAFFDIDGFLFGLFDARFAEEEPRIGANCVPTIEVEDADAVHGRLSEAGLETVMAPHTVEGMRITQVKDSEGNVLEFYHRLGDAD